MGLLPNVLLSILKMLYVSYNCVTNFLNMALAYADIFPNILFSEKVMQWTKSGNGNVNQVDY
jgi:hypothetical protein